HCAGLHGVATHSRGGISAECGIRECGIRLRRRGKAGSFSPLPPGALVSTHLVPRLRLGTQCPAGSACPAGNLAGGLRKSRQSLDGSTFPGGAWERESPAKTRCVDTNAPGEGLGVRRGTKRRSLTPDPSPGGKGEKSPPMSTRAAPPRRRLKTRGGS